MYSFKWFFKILMKILSIFAPFSLHFTLGWHWFREWFGATPVASHYLSWCWQNVTTPFGIIMSQLNLCVCVYFHWTEWKEIRVCGSNEWYNFMISTLLYQNKVIWACHTPPPPPPPPPSLWWNMGKFCEFIILCSTLNIDVLLATLWYF